MRTILFVTSSLKVGGAELQLLKLANALSRKDYQVHIVAFDDGPLRDEFEKCCSSLQIEDTYLMRALTIRKQVSALSPDILHCYGGSAALHARLFTWIGRQKIVTSERSSPKRKSFMERASDLFLNTFTNAITTNSEHAARELTKMGLVERNKITVIRNGVEIFEPSAKEFKPLSSEPVKIGYLANFSPVKNHEFLIEAAKRCEQHGLEVHFVLAGAGEGSFHNLLLEHGLLDSFTLLGSISDTKSFFQSIDIYTHISHFEGCSNSVLEAMGAGVPLLLTDIPANRELVSGDRSTDAGFIFQHSNPTSFASLLAEMLAEPARTTKRAEVAHTLAMQRYSLEAHLRSVEELYDQLTGESD